MLTSVVITRTYTVILPVSLGFNVSGDTLISQIRETEDPDSDLITEWEIDFYTDGKDGELELTLSGFITDDMPLGTGFMDIAKVVGDTHISFLDQLIPVVFIDP